jgi:hypothetical protein
MVTKREVTDAVHARGCNGEGERPVPTTEGGSCLVTYREEQRLVDLRDHLLDSHEISTDIADVVGRMDMIDLSVYHSELHLSEEIYQHDR